MHSTATEKNTKAAWENGLLTIQTGDQAYDNPRDWTVVDIQADQK